ncbi:uncharacterized protein LOC125491869 [Beta vulgaris subsp. vulgaris]|uniref:uncharacterized protein LOC125491869 n=1 Tax=Beta vulgaris subsp. vulgaris TaxID=3555 RepID=UPI002036FECE|nr:uncharacterized protein LOC125491869 [Beta vulgaris subsp. vulgaris]
MQLCRAFLWEGKAYLTKAPLVSWDWVCRPKKSGGLGIRDCKLWNMAAIGKYTWQIAQKEDTLWIKWVHCIYIKNENWWTYVAPSSASWSWKVICKMKDKMKVAYHNNLWMDGSRDYTVKEGYNWLRGDQDTVWWKHWVWNPINIPKHSFIAWLTMLGRLRTREKLQQAGICQDASCLLCQQGQDSCSHLFFQCQFSQEVCRGIMNWLHLRMSAQESIYNHWRKWGRKFRSKVQQQVAYASLAASVYHIWRAINNSLWEAAVWRPAVVIKKIQLDICIRVKSKLSHTWKDSDQLWFA